jgi:hypothetical protein
MIKTSLYSIFMLSMNIIYNLKVSYNVFSITNEFSKLQSSYYHVYITNIIHIYNIVLFTIQIIIETTRKRKIRKTRKRIYNVNFINFFKLIIILV